MDVNDRLNKLERTAKRWRMGAIVLAIAAGVGLVMGADDDGVHTFDKIRVQSIEIVDDQGHARINIEVLGGSIPSLMMMDSDGKLRTSIATTDTGPGIGFYDRDLNQLIELGIIENGPALKMRAKGGLMLGALSDEPALMFYDEKENKRGSMSVTDAGFEVILCNNKGDTRAFLKTNQSGSGLHLFDGNGKKRSILTAGDDGSALIIRDSHTERKSVIFHGRGRNYMKFYNDNGDTIFKVP